jgi:hypothetical protein
MKLPPYVKMLTAPSSVIGRFSLALLVVSTLIESGEKSTKMYMRNAWGAFCNCFLGQNSGSTTIYSQRTFHYSY